MRAHLRLELRDRNRALMAERHADNAVMQAGAMLLAQLFAGMGTNITHMGVGTSDAPEDDSYNTTALSNEAAGDADPLSGDLDAEIPAGAFTIELDETRRVVRIRVRGTLPDEAAVGTIREAGLLSRGDDGDVLYNRVTFAPIIKDETHELTLFWDVTFPYGDLHWLS
jgi:hypothetical protein